MLSKKYKKPLPLMINLKSELALISLYLTKSTALCTNENYKQAHREVDNLIERFPSDHTCGL